MPSQPGIFPLHVPTPRPPPPTQRSPARSAAVFFRTWEEARAREGHRLWVLTAKLNIKEGQETPLSSLTLEERSGENGDVFARFGDPRIQELALERSQSHLVWLISTPSLSGTALGLLVTRGYLLVNRE